MTTDKHIYFSNEESARIKDYANNNNLSFSKAVCNLTNIALNNIKTEEKLYSIQRSISSLIHKQNLIFLLLKQLYSDLDFENITDPKKSKAVNEFMKRVDISKYIS